MSSEQEHSATKSQKRAAPKFREQGLKKVSSNRGEGKFLFINSKKQKVNNNYLFQNSVSNLHQDIKKY